MSWNYVQPVKIIFGSGKLAELTKLISDFKRPLLITTPFFTDNGLAAQVLDKIGGDLFDNVSENPDVSEVNECSRFLRENGNDVIIALGGGSVIDLAKAASVAAKDIAEYHGTGKAVPAEHLPLIAVPTTAGTGSEVTCVSVLSNRSINKKAPILSESFYAKIALIDPELTLSMPPRVTASTGIDVLSHAIEGFRSKGHQPICDALAVHAARLVFDWLPKAYENPDDITAREKMAEASVIAGLAFSMPKTASSHACSFPLTAIYHIPHGEACGLTLDHFIRLDSDGERTTELARLLGFSDGNALADAVYSLKKSIDLRTSISDLNLTNDDIINLVSFSHHPNLLNDPYNITDDNLIDMYRKLCNNSNDTPI